MTAAQGQLQDVSPRAFRLVDLFAGCGGLTQGFRQAGFSEFRPVGAVELDPAAARTYAANHGEHVSAADIIHWLEGELPDADVVIGGPPCQGYSSLGSQKVDDPRNALWRAYAQAVARIRPTVFVLENVPPFLKSVQYLNLVKECGEGGLLAGYEIRKGVLNSADFGAAQARRRAVIIGTLAPVAPVELPVGDSGTERTTVSDVFAGITARVTETELPMRRDGQYPGPYSSAELHVTRSYQQRSLQRFRCIPAGGNRFDLPDDLLSPCWRKHTSGSGDVMGRLKADAPSVTIRTEFFKPEKGRYLHPTEHRAITHFEAARIQGFPDDYKWFGTKVGIARQIGNAVPIPLAEALADHIARSLHLEDGERGAERLVGR